MPSESERQPVITRAPKEFQRAHDILVSIIINAQMQEDVLGKESPERAETIRCIKSAADVLCWALGHDHNANFEYNLGDLEFSLRAAGYEMRDTGRLSLLEEGTNGPIPG